MLTHSALVRELGLLTSTEPRRTPAWEALPRLPDRDERHAWDVWGRDDEIGTVNLIGPEQRLAAIRTVRTGEMISLNLPLDEPDPGLFSERSKYDHVVEVTEVGRDEHLDGFFPQGSSQWDGLRHIHAGRHGYYGGRTDEVLDSTDVLGIDRWSRHGIGGRGVLLDVARHLLDTGRDMAPDEPFEITVDLLEETAAAHDVRLKSGDLLLVRTGWTEWYSDLDLDRRHRMRGTVGSGFACPGLESTRSMAAWLWDQEVAAVAVDNPGVEVFPIDRDKGFLHRRLIALQGMPLGELWDLARLSAACEERGSREFLLFSGVMPLRRGVGSPANAHALL